MTDETRVSRDVLARRTEKQWRHEERELTSTHAFWGALIGLHGVLAGLAGVLVGEAAFPPSAFIVIGALSLLCMVSLAILNFLSRTADKRRAEYFAVTSQKVWPESFDKERENNSSKAAVKRYVFWQRPVEVIVMVLFLVNALIFGFAVLGYG